MIVEASMGGKDATLRIKGENLITENLSAKRTRIKVYCLYFNFLTYYREKKIIILFEKIFLKLILKYVFLNL